MHVECINAERDVITHLPNPIMKKLKKQQPRLRDIKFSEENSTGEPLPVQLLLGVQDYNNIRMPKAPLIGQKPIYPVAEKTKLGWVLFGGEATTTDREFCQLTMTGQQQFEKLCNLNVLGVKYQPETDFKHEDFKTQISLMENGHYATKLPWKVSHDK